MRTDDQIFLTEDQRVIVYEAHNQRLHYLGDVEEELREWLTDRDYIAMMNKLGLAPVVDIGKARQPLARRPDRT